MRTTLPDVRFIDALKYRGALPAEAQGDRWHEFDVFLVYGMAGVTPFLVQGQNLGDGMGWSGAWSWTAVDFLGQPLRRKIIARWKTELTQGFPCPQAETAGLDLIPTDRTVYDEAVLAVVLAFYGKHLRRLEPPRWPSGKPNWSASLRPPRCISLQCPGKDAYFQFPSPGTQE